MNLQATIRSERRCKQVSGDGYVKIVLRAGGAYFGTLLFGVGQNPDGDEGDQAYLLKHVDNDDVFTWLPIPKGRKPKRESRDGDRRGGQITSPSHGNETN